MDLLTEVTSAPKSVLNDDEVFSIDKFGDNFLKELAIKKHELQKEKLRLLQDNEAAQEDINAVSSDLEQLKNVRYYVSKVQPEPEEVVEIVQAQTEEPEKKKSIREALKDNQRKIAQRESHKEN